MNKNRVVVTGLGAVCSLGHDVNTIWNNVVAGRPSMTPITRFDVSGLRTKFAAQIQDFDLEDALDRRTVRRMGRYVSSTMAVANQAMADAELDATQVDPVRAGVIIGSAIGGIESLLENYDQLKERGTRRISPFAVPSILIDTAPGQVAIDHGFRGVNYGIVGACASGNYGVGEAFRTIFNGDADVMLSGGADFGLNVFTMAGFERARVTSARNDDPNGASRPFDISRDGFVMGEGAIMMVMERLEHAQARGAHIYGEILGYSATADAFHLTAPHEEGLGAIEAMSQAIERAGLKPEDIDYINAHGTSTQLNDIAETRAIKHVFGENAYGTPVSSTKSVTGHLLGAAGALETMICLKAISAGMIPPTINHETPDPECDLDYVPNVARKQDIRYVASNSFGFGGHNSCLVFGGVSDGR